MFCPSCGAEERQISQFCRACGVDMRPVRTALQKPDSITASAVSAREEIGRAIAGKIHELKSAKELGKIVEDVLPEVEKFLESPEERRLRRLRAGVITAAVGLGVMIVLLLSPHIRFFFGWPAGLAVHLIGLGILVNGLLFSRPHKQLPAHPQSVPTQNMLDQMLPLPAVREGFSTTEQLTPIPPSVTENTTRQLPDEPAKAS